MADNSVGISIGFAAHTNFDCLGITFCNSGLDNKSFTFATSDSTIAIPTGVGCK